MVNAAPSAAPPPASPGPWRYAPVGVLVALLLALLGWAAATGTGPEALADRLGAWRMEAGARPLLWAAGFALAYAALVSVSAPGALWFTLAGGALLGAGWGAAASLVGATAGACLAFWAARTALGDRLRARAGPRVDALARELEGSPFLAITALRLAPLPFFLVNLAAANLRVRLSTFAAGTAVGMTPATIAYAALGAAAGEAAAGDGPVNLSAAASDPRVAGGLVLLACLGAFGFVWSRRRQRRGRS